MTDHCLSSLAGLSAAVDLEVGATDTAVALRSGDVEVLATPRILALCEEATVAAVAAHLPDGVTTVGVHVELDHLRANGLGDRVAATAIVTAVEDRQLTFAVEVTDGEGSVARGTVVRAAVDRERFASRVTR
jgi:fluoroacetyl-CoA thioesterase